MKIPDKVTLEIRPDGWTWTVFSRDEALGTDTMRRSGRGEYKGVEKGYLIDRLPQELDELAEAIESEDASAISQFLDDVREE